MGLNPGQQIAVDNTSNKILCLAGAGVGKTFTLLHRISRLIEAGTKPDSILVLTFTNAAAKNMADRFSRDATPEFKTFHAFCYSLLIKDAEVRSKLGYKDTPRIINDAEYKLVLNKAKLDSGVKLNSRQLSGNSLRTPKDKFEYQLFNKFLARTLIKENLITFDKLCYEVCELFVNDDASILKYKSQYKVIMLDEFQDTDPKQWKFAQSFKDADLFVVGDALQSLYSFRGADSTIIKGLASDPEWTTLRLTENYRSTKQICEFANSMSTYADPNYRVEIHSGREGSEVVLDTSSSLDDCIQQYISTNQVTAVLCRTNREVDTIRAKYITYFENYEKYLKMCYAVDVYRSYLNPEHAIVFLASFLPSDTYEEFLRQESIYPNMTVSQFLNLFSTEYTQKYANEIQQVTNLLSETDTPSTTLMKLANYYEVDADTLFKVTENVDSEDDVIHALSTIATIYKDSNAALYVGTIHSSKGLEYDNVILYNVDSPSFMLEGEDNLNLYYVGITRAKNNLCVLKGV